VKAWWLSILDVLAGAFLKALADALRANKAAADQKKAIRNEARAKLEAQAADAREVMRKDMQDAQARAPATRRALVERLRRVASEDQAGSGGAK
jgi:hypothetical protein